MADKTDKALIGNELIEENIVYLKDSFTEENLAVLLTTFRKRILDAGQFVVAVDTSGNDINLTLKTANYNGKKWFVAFTSFDEELKGDGSVMSGFLADIGQLFDMALKSDEVEGVIINPYGNMLSVNKAIIMAVKGE